MLPQGFVCNFIFSWYLFLGDLIAFHCLNHHLNFAHYQGFSPPSWSAGSLCLSVCWGYRTHRHLESSTSTAYLTALSPDGAPFPYTGQRHHSLPILGLPWIPPFLPPDHQLIPSCLQQPPPGLSFLWSYLPHFLLDRFF